jgi:hypothetical protein
VPGGRHPGAGTANAIVTLGSHQYLELIAVVDAGEAAGSARSGRIAEAVARGATFASWAVRVDDLETARARLGATGEIQAGARERPDGVRLEWRSLDLEPGLPFLISWGGASHPGELGDGRVVSVVLEDSPGGPLRRLLDAAGLDVRYEVRAGAGPRLVSLEVETGGRTLTIS